MSKIRHVAYGEARTVDYVAQADHTDPHEVVVLGSVSGEAARIGVTHKAVMTGEIVAVEYNTAWLLPKVSGAVIAQGDSVNWDASAGAVDDNAATPAAGDVAGFGMARKAAGSGELWVEVDLGAGPGVLT